MTEKVGKQPSDSGIQSDVLDFGGVFFNARSFCDCRTSSQGKVTM